MLIFISQIRIYNVFIYISVINSFNIEHGYPFNISHVSRLITDLVCVRHKVLEGSREGASVLIVIQHKTVQRLNYSEYRESGIPIDVKWNTLQFYAKNALYLMQKLDYIS